MPRIVLGALAILISVMLDATAYASPLQDDARGSTPAAQADTRSALQTRTKRVRASKTTRWRSYGFLPGYRTPERIAWERARSRGPVYWYGYPRFYRGRWNGGGFGPCWTQTPIGPHWNCG